MKRIFLIALFIPFLVLPQKQYQILKPDGKTYAVNKLIQTGEDEILRIKKNHRKKNNLNKLTHTAEWLDTLSWSVPPSVNFGFFGQDRMAQWFQAPADMIIHAAGFNVASFDDSLTELDLKLVKVNWTVQQILDHWGDQWIGYYPAAGNGMNDATAFLDDPDRTGDWVSAEGDTLGDLFGEYIWDNGANACGILPIADGEYQWVEMTPIDSLPIVHQGDVLAVVLKNCSPSMDENRIGFVADNTLGIPGFKYYANGRLDPPNDLGWWSRIYTWDFALEVELTEGCWGDPEIWIQNSDPPPLGFPPVIQAEIIDCPNPGLPDGVAFADLYYKYDYQEDFISIPMRDEGGNIWSAVLPLPDFTAELAYYIYAEDVNGNGNETWNHNMIIYIFTPTYPNLLVFNGYNSLSGYPQSYYFGHDDFVNYSALDWDHDVWVFGPLTTELVNNYQNIIEICTNGPNDYNNEVIRQWLAADPDRNYLLAGQEYLGVKYNFEDKDFGSGDFEYDILGITHSFNDVSWDGTTGQQTPSRIFAIENSQLGGELYNLFSSNGTDSLRYDPVFENGGIDNWIDGFEVTEDTQIDMTVESRGIASQPQIDTLTTAAHRTLPAGNKIAFLAYDPISVNSAPDYYWYGFSATAPQVKALEWFGITLTGVEINAPVSPGKFALYQNYPNPFNPTTTIEYSIPKPGSVTLTVYDILGREVAALVNKEQKPGFYEVEFNAENLSSGVYFYQLKAGGFQQTKKLILMK